MLTKKSVLLPLLVLGLTLVLPFGFAALQAQETHPAFASSSAAFDSATPLLAQWPNYPYDEDSPHAIERGPGGYLSWWKILIIVIVFGCWIKATDFINKDSSEMHEITGMIPQLWNPISLFAFVIGFGLVITVPWFLAGLPVYMLVTALPFLLYVVLRNGKVNDPDNKAFTSVEWIRRYMQGKVYMVREKELAAMVGPEIDFEASGNSGEDRQSNLIRARQAEHFPAVKQLVFDAITKRASNVVMDYSQQAVQIRFEIDGFWHNMGTLDRVTGDSMLVALKFLGNLNPADRRSRQVGHFRGVIELEKTQIQIMTQGVKTGEQATLKIAQAYAERLNLSQIGMWPESVEAMTQAMNGPGITIISAPPKSGLSTTWQSAINGSDRMMRDCVALVDPNENETKFENVARHEMVQNGQGDLKELQSLLLRNPDVYIVPEHPDSPFMDALFESVFAENRCLITKVAAASPVEAILRVMQTTSARKAFAEKVTFASSQKLVRRLCDACKQPTQVNPNFLQKLGVKPGDEVNVCVPYQLPPPEQRVDENGNPIQMDECQSCGGLGYVGRIAVVETLEVNDTFRKALITTPKLDVLTQLARQQGNLPMIHQGYRLALAGITSIQEVQRIFQQKK